MNGPATVILKGSPAISSNSMRLAKAVLERVGGVNHVVELYREAIMPCNACGSCYDGNPCPLDDAVPGILKAIASSDLIILATPLHFIAPSAPVVALFSRFQQAWMAKERGESFLPPRRRQAALVVTGGADYLDMFAPVRAIAGAAFASLGIPVAGMVTAINTDTLPVSDNPYAMETARELGEKILGAFQAGGICGRES